jgi:ABC-2 type transport system permease protein
LRRFSKLVVNEWLKMSKKRSFYIAYAVLLLATIGFTYIIMEMSNGQELPSALDFTASVIGRSGLGQITSFLAIIYSAGVLAKEYQLGTIKLLLIRGHSRTAVLASKYVAVLLFVLSLILFSLATALIAGFVTLDYSGGESNWSDIWLTALYQTIYTVIYVTLTFMFGVLTKSTGATIGIGMLAVLMESIFNALLAKYEFYKYFFFLNTDLSVYRIGETPADGMTLTFSSIVALVYVLLFLGVSFVTFKKRDIA